MTFSKVGSFIPVRTADNVVGAVAVEVREGRAFAVELLSEEDAVERQGCRGCCVRFRRDGLRHCVLYFMSGHPW